MCVKILADDEDDEGVEEKSVSTTVWPSNYTLAGYPSYNQHQNLKGVYTKTDTMCAQPATATGDTGHNHFFLVYIDQLSNFDCRALLFYAGLSSSAGATAPPCIKNPTA